MTLIPFYAMGFTYAFSGLETFGIILMFSGIVLTILYALLSLFLIFFTSLKKHHKQALKKSLLYLLLGVFIGFVLVYGYSLILTHKGLRGSL